MESHEFAPAGPRTEAVPTRSAPAGPPAGPPADPGGGNHPLRSFVASGGPVPSTPPPGPPGGPPSRRVPLGTFVHARSGDKGGDANLGLWVSALDPRAEARAAWLLDEVTPEWVRALLPESEHLDVEVHPLPNLGAVNVIVEGLLGQGVAAGSRFDPQAKGLGEWARSRLVEVPEELL